MINELFKFGRNKKENNVSIKLIVYFILPSAHMTQCPDLP